MASRYYVVTEYSVESGDDIPAVISERLVDAISDAQAISHVVAPRFSAAPASPRDVARLMAKGVMPESAKKAT